jgi:hypothetical protein
MGEDAVMHKLNGLVRILQLSLNTDANYHNIKRNQGKRIDDEIIQLPPEVFGRPKAPAGTWASCIRIIDPIEVYPLLSL